MYIYNGTVDFGAGLIVENPKFELEEVRYFPKLHKVSASISFIVNEAESYRYVREYSQDLGEDIGLLDAAILDALVMAFEVDGTIERIED